MIFITHQHVLALLMKSFLRAVVNATEDQEFSVPYHFHEHQEEYMRVTRGYLDFIIDGKKVHLTPEMEPLHVKPGMKHSIHKPKGVWSQFSEQAVPDQEAKTTFFRELLAYGPVCAILTLRLGSI